MEGAEAYQPSHLKAELLDQNHPGPWSEDDDAAYALFKQSIEERSKLANVPRKVEPPNSHAEDGLQMAFYRVNDIPLPYYGVNVEHDLLTTKEMLDRSGQGVPNEIDTHRANNLLYITLRRLETEGLDRKHEPSLQALTVISNIARKGQKIAYVHAHGISTQGHLTLEGTGASGKGYKEAQETAQELSDQASAKQYGAILFGACNAEGIPIQMTSRTGKIGIPVIAFTSDNSRSQAQAQVYWPKVAV